MVTDLRLEPAGPSGFPVGPIATARLGGSVVDQTQKECGCGKNGRAPRQRVRAHVLFPFGVRPACSAGRPVILAAEDSSKPARRV